MKLPVALTVPAVVYDPLVLPASTVILTVVN